MKKKRKNICLLYGFFTKSRTKNVTFKLTIFTQHVDYLFIPSFFIKMLFLVTDFMVKIHIILKLYVALPFYI